MAAAQSPVWPNALHQSNAQLTVIPLPNPLPFSGLVGANTCWHDPVRNTLVCRCTDINTIPDNMPNHSSEVTDGGGGFEEQFNADGRILRVMAAGSGHSWLLGVNRVNHTCSPAIPGSEAPAGAEFDKRNPNLDYNLVGAVVYQRQFDENNLTTIPVTTLLFDFRVVCPNLAGLNVIWHSPLQILADDSAFIASFSDRGGQDTGEWVAIYQPATGGCQTWNTMTRTITGQGFGQSGLPSSPYSFTIHDVSAGPGGILHVASGTCVSCPPNGGWLWKAGTLQTNLITPAVGGHNGLGWETYVNTINGPNFVVRPWYDTAHPVQIDKLTNVHWPPGTEVHVSWEPDVLDSSPFLVGSSTIGFNPLVITSVLQQELFLVEFDGTVRRIAPTFSSGILNDFNFRAAFAISSLSKQGDIAFSSDGMGQLGNTNGATIPCTLGAPAPNKCRSDVFVVFQQ